MTHRAGAGKVYMYDVLFSMQLSAVEFVVAGDRMLPECERHLHDPQNEVLAHASYPARFFNPSAPWVRSGAYQNFRTTTFYLLRRRA